ncbi:uncharacterized protein LOC144127937 [Amblyomma americanum]
MLRPPVTRRPHQLGKLLVAHWYHGRCQVRHASTYALDADQALQPVDLLEHKLRVSTCGALYREWRKTRREYRNAPVDGIEIDMNFICSRMTDEGTLAETGRPLAVLLHGAPGSYRDFTENLIPRLLSRGVDVLAPNYPDMAFSLRNKFYWHTVEERTTLLRDFFRQLGIRRINTLIAHSASVYPSLRLLTEGEAGPKIDSLVFLAPNSHITPNSLKPAWLTGWLMQAYRNSLLRPLVSALVLFGCYSGLLPVKPVVQDALLSLTTYKLSGFDKGGEKLLEAVARRRLPTLVAISENDRLLTYEALMGVCTVLGASTGDVWHYDRDSQLVTPGTAGSWLKVLSFKQGSHYPFVRHPDVCADEIVLLLQKIGALR